MWNTGSTYNLSSGMAVAGEEPVGAGRGAPAGVGGGDDMASASPPLTSPALHTGMPTAYDLSSVIAGGSSVGHNNLIPLGECPQGPAGSGVGGHCSLGPGLSAPRSPSLPSLPGAPGRGPAFRSSPRTLQPPRPPSPHPSAERVGRAGGGDAVSLPSSLPLAAQPTRGLSITPTPGWAP